MEIEKLKIGHQLWIAITRYSVNQIEIFPIWFTNSNNQCQSYESKLSWFFGAIRKMLRFSFVYFLWLFSFSSEISCLVRKFERNSELLVSDLVDGSREQIISKLLFSDGVIKQGLTPNVVFILACTRFGWKHSQSFAISSCKQYLWQLWN